MAQELFPLVERQDGLVKVFGLATRDYVHEHSLRHLAVQIIPVALDESGNDCVLYMHRRSRFKRTSPNKLDFAGGHVTFDESILPRLQWDSPVMLEKASFMTALRESQEEVHCDPPITLTEETLLRFGDVCAFECDAPREDGSRNVEYSTAFVLGLPSGQRVTIRDTDREGERELAVESMRLELVLEKFRQNPEDFADGAERVLTKVVENNELANELRKLMLKAASVAEVRSSPFVRSLRAREKEFLQVLLTDFSLERLGEGSVLSIYLGGDAPTISVREAKHDVKSRIRDFNAKAKKLQKQLDDFLVEKIGTEPLISDPTFPFRYGSGGALPVLHLKGEEYYCLFYRDVDPIGWNIANGGTDTLTELLDPIETMHRELREELVIVNLKRKWRYVFADNYGKPLSLPEFAVARQIWKEHFPHHDFPSFEEIELPLKWDNGPDELRIRTDLAGPQTISDCFLNINAEDFGIEVDRIAHLNIAEDTILCDGEIIDGHLLNRVIGLFKVDETNLRVLSGETSFLPSHIFHSAKRLDDGSELDSEVKQFIKDARCIRTKKELEDFEKGLKGGEPYGLCPVSKRIIRRYAKLQQAMSPPEQKIKEQVKVFICFAYEDLSLAMQVCEFIEKRMGKVVFFSKQNNDPAFLDAIFKALDTANCLVALATKPHHLEKNWPHFEWTSFIVRMFDSQKEKLRIIPFIQGFTPRELPSQLRTFQTVEVEPQGIQAALEELDKFLSFCCQQ